MKLLAIDDIRDNLVALGALIKTFVPEARLITSLSGREGVALAAVEQPDTILLDIQMPAMDGYEATRLLKADPLTRHIPIILMTALKTDAASKVRGLEAGADAFLAKPIDEAELVAQIRAMVRIKRSEDDLRRERDSLERQVMDRVRDLHEKQRQNRLLLDAIPHVALLADRRDRTILAQNRSAAEAGLKVGDYCWRGLYNMEAVPEEQRKAFRETGIAPPGTRCQHCLADEATLTQQTLHAELELGGKIWSIWWSPIDEDQYLHYAMDVTEHRQLEAQLRHSLKLESVGRLAGGVAHDFNNKLTVIMGHAELAEMKCGADHPVAGHLQEIIRAAEHSRSITGKLLAFSRQQVASPQVIDLNRGIEETLRGLSQLIGEDITLTFTPAVEECSVRIDPVQLDQIIMNLAVNARDAMPDCGRIAIETSHVEVDQAVCQKFLYANPGAYVKISFRDNGCGMDQETIKHIFEPFYTTKGVGKGTGLGLATSYGIVAQHLGFITVASSPGCGALFEIYLPRHHGRHDEDSAPLLPASGGSGTVLLVEDEEAVRKMTQIMLEAGGYTVIAAETPAQGIAIASDPSATIDLVLTDVIMPLMSGRTMVDEIRQLRAGIRVVYMSGYTAEVIARTGVQGEQVDLLQKPFSYGQLMEITRQAIG